MTWYCGLEEWASHGIIGNGQRDWHEVIPYTLTGTNTCHAHRVQQLPEKSRRIIHSYPLFVRICMHQTFSLYERANPANIQPAVVQSDFVYKNTGRIFSRMQEN